MAGQVSAQFGNEWIRFNQQYYKIPVAKDGIYRLTYADLQNAGFPVGSIDPRRIQIFHRGVEQRIIVQGENDAAFNPGDYLEFYGRRNDGVSDAELYEPQSAQPNQYYNLYSDSTSYFLTVISIAQQGLRMIPFSEVNVTNIPAEIFQQDQKLLVLTSDYNSGKVYNQYLQNTFFDVGEGWTGTWIFQNQQLDYVIDNILNTVPASGTPQLEVQLVGRIDVLHRAEISVGPSSPSRVVHTANFSGSNVANISVPLNWSDVGADGKMTVRVKALGVSGASDRLSVNYIKITYPRNFNQVSGTERIYQLRENGGGKSYVEIQNAPAGTRLFDVTNPASVVPIGTTTTTTLNAVINNTSSSRKILSTTGFITPRVRRISFRNMDPSLHDYIIISHSQLMKAGGGYSDPVKAYASYRTSPEGGSYDTLIADIDQLYDQFNYGEISPIAIRRFMKFMINSGDPRYLFLIGKGLDVYVTTDANPALGYYRNPTAFPLHSYIPTAGFPASDIYFTAGLNGAGYEPGVPTGRITANTPQDVSAYLNKVKEMEALPFNDLWRKELLHLSGGIGAGEPELFKTFMEQFGEIAKGFYLGGKVSAIAKNNTELEFINISDKLNSGVGLITLFGHSSPSQNDFNIGFVSAPELGYNNPGKYPMLLINGCNAGDFFTNVTRYGEDWINTPNKGAVGFLANTSFGYSSLLRLYSQFFYETAYADSTFIYKGIGDIQKETVRKLTSINTQVAYVTQGQQMLLLGDPAVKLFGARKPDYETNDNHVYAESYNAEPITALSDSFAIKIIVRNFGRAKEDSVAVRIVRTFSDNTSITYDSIFYTVLYKDTLEFTMYKDDRGFGNNVFSITLDPSDEINEIDNNNNTAELTLFVPLNAARNLFPQGYSIVNTSTVKLLVQSTNVLDNPRGFIIQIDTVDTFSSQYMQQITVNGKIASADVNITTVKDTLAFYWRTRLSQPLSNESSDWSTTSFTYIKNGPEGWAQIHFPQYVSNDASGLTIDHGSRLLRLKETITTVDIHTFGSNYPGYITDPDFGKQYHPNFSVKVGGTEFHPISLVQADARSACRRNSLNLLAFDKTTAGPYMAVPVQFPDYRACGRRPEIITNFLVSEFETGDGKDLMQYIDNVATGDSVVLFSLGDVGFASWSANVRSKLANLGISAAQISSLQPGEPVVIYARKGAAAGSALVMKTATAPVNQQALQASGTITGRFTSGTMTSSIIGPAVEWHTLFTKSVASELPVTDEFSFDVIGITVTGAETMLKTNLTGTPESINDIDAEEYPYLKIVYHAADEVSLTAPQLKKWIVSYTPAAEGVLVFNGPTEMQHLKEGENWTGNYAFRNISSKEFSDSLLVQYSTYNTTYRTSENKIKRIKAPAPGLETAFGITVSSEDKSGLNDVKVVVNPRILPEIYYDNNVITFRDHLNVQVDIFNPVLDVTVDGRYILNGDFVSSNPSIVLKLWDENSLLLKTDTLGINVVLKYPCGNENCPFTAIYFKRSDVTWHPASSTSDFTMEFNPENLPVGEYTLRVEAKDVRNNASGTEPYEISFVVSEDQSILIQKPYPNPSSSIFFFNVVITSDEQPDNMRMEIVNSSGQVVAEYSKYDFFTGTNLIPWDASNLPGGLYLYRIVLIRAGREIKKANGKLMLAR